MGLIYNSPGLAALALTRLRRRVRRPPGGLDGRMHDYLADLEQRNGTACLKLMAIALTRVHFKALDDLAHGSTYQDANAALERTISEGCRLIIALK